jgi:hypothetical protein
MEIGGIPQGVIVYWHVNATNVSGTSVWSNTWIFMTNPTAVLTQMMQFIQKEYHFQTQVLHTFFRQLRMYPFFSMT